MIDQDELKWLGEPLRVATYRQGANGRSAAQIGIANALARGRGNAPAARTVPTARTVAPTQPKASTSKPQDRVKVVAHALETDPALKGKAADALCFLADPEFAGVTGQGVIKLLKAGATAEPPKLAITTTKPTATRKRSDALGGGNQPTAESKASWDRVYDRMFGAKA